jgi:hypothetical protein
MLQKDGPSEERDEKCHILADSHWEILLKAVRQLLGMGKMHRWAQSAMDRWIDTDSID